MKMTPLFTHLQPILDVYDFLLSREYNQSCIKKVKKWQQMVVRVFKQNKVHPSIIKKYSTRHTLNVTLLWTRIQQLVEARDYGL